MYLIHLITLNGLLCNRRVHVVYIKLADNKLSDALSRMDMLHFRNEGKNLNEFPDKINTSVASAQDLFTGSLG